MRIPESFPALSAVAALPALMALAGLVIGIWMRILVVRHSVAEGESLRRDCPRCGAPLPVPGGGRSRWTEALPALRRRGRSSRVGSPSATRCPECSERVGPPPLAVEAVTVLVLVVLTLRAMSPGPTGATTAFLPAQEGASPGELVAFGWLAVVAVALVFIDAAVHRLPDRLTLAAYLGTAVPLTMTAFVEDRFGNLLGAGLGGLALVVFYLVLFLINPAGMGLGDVKFAASLGTALGWLGWDTLIAGTFLGLLGGGLYGAALMILRRAGRKSEIPFGPFMAAGAFAAVLAGV